MKIHLVKIPEKGLRQACSLPLSALARITEVIGPQTGRVEAELMLKNHEGVVEITGRLRADLQPPCQRCLEPVPFQIDEEVLVALTPQSQYEETAEDVNLGVGELEVSFYEGEEVDLSAIIEDELLLLIPEAVCEEDEHERCLICGKKLEDLFVAEPESNENHPFAQLKQFLPED